VCVCVCVFVNSDCMSLCFTHALTSFLFITRSNIWIPFDSSETFFFDFGSTLSLTALLSVCVCVWLLKVGFPFVFERLNCTQKKSNGIDAHPFLCYFPSCLLHKRENESLSLPCSHFFLSEREKTYLQRKRSFSSIHRIGNSFFFFFSLSAYCTI